MRTALEIYFGLNLFLAGAYTGDNEFRPRQLIFWKVGAFMFLFGGLFIAVALLWQVIGQKARYAIRDFGFLLEVVFTRMHKNADPDEVARVKQIKPANFITRYAIKLYLKQNALES